MLAIHNYSNNLIIKISKICISKMCINNSHKITIKLIDNNRCSSNSNNHFKSRVKINKILIIITRIKTLTNKINLLDKINKICSNNKI